MEYENTPWIDILQNKGKQHIDTNLALKNPKKTNELHEKLKEWRSEINAPMPKRNEGGGPKKGSNKKKKS